MREINLLTECAGASRIGISAHVRPDGDAVGACMALYGYMKKLLPEAEVSVFLEKPSDVFRNLKYIEEADGLFEDRRPFDVFFALDTTKERLGGAEKYFELAHKTVNIDHHISNRTDRKSVV